LLQVHISEYHRQILSYFGNFLLIKGEKIDIKHLKETLNILDKKNNFSSTYITLLKLIKRTDQNFTHLNENFFKFNSYFQILEVINIYQIIPKTEKSKFKNRLIEYALEKANFQLLFLIIDSKICRNSKIKSFYKEKFIDFLDNKSNIESRHDLIIVKQFFTIVYQNLIVISIEDFKVKKEIIEFLLNPKKFQKEKFRVEWIKKIDWPIFIEKFALIDYILESLEKSLLENFDDELSKVYFKIKKLKILV